MKGVMRFWVLGASCLVSEGFGQDEPPRPFEPVLRNDVWVNRHPAELLKIEGVVGYGSHPWVSGPPGALVVVVEDDKVIPMLPRYLVTHPPGTFPSVGNVTMEWEVTPIMWALPGDERFSGFREGDLPYRIFVRILGADSRIPKDINGLPVQTFVVDEGWFFRWPGKRFTPADRIPTLVEGDASLEEAPKKGSRPWWKGLPFVRQAFWKVVKAPRGSLLDKIKGLRGSRK